MTHVRRHNSRRERFKTTVQALQTSMEDFAAALPEDQAFLLGNLHDAMAGCMHLVSQEDALMVAGKLVGSLAAMVPRERRNKTHDILFETIEGAYETLSMSIDTAELEPASIGATRQ